MTNPDDRNDPWRESLKCYESVADEVVVVGDDWPYEFDWGIFNKIYQNGFDQCKTDWVIRMDLDYFIHEKDIEKLKFYINKFKDEPAIFYL
jgi:glycerol-3-phosphate cytidylyltransferase-like family protein